MKNFHVQSILSQNITLVYPSIDFQAIDSNAIRYLASTPAEQMLFAGERIHVAYPLPGTLLVQIGENRVLVIQKEPADELGTLPLWETAWKCNQLIPGTGPTAYGFNYDVDLVLDNGNATTALSKLVAPDIQQIEQILDGALHSALFTSRFSFQREHVAYDLVIQPVDQQHIRIHFNTHYEASRGLPEVKELEKTYRYEFDELLAIFNRL